MLKKWSDVNGAPVAVSSSQNKSKSLHGCDRMASFTSYVNLRFKTVRRSQDVTVLISAGFVAKSSACWNLWLTADRTKGVTSQLLADMTYEQPHEDHMRLINDAKLHPSFIETAWLNVAVVQTSGLRLIEPKELRHNCWLTWHTNKFTTITCDL